MGVGETAAQHCVGFRPSADLNTTQHGNIYINTVGGCDGAQRTQVRKSEINDLKGDLKSQHLQDNKPKHLQMSVLLQSPPTHTPQAWSSSGCLPVNRKIILRLWLPEAILAAMILAAHLRAPSPLLKGSWRWWEPWRWRGFIVENSCRLNCFSLLICSSHI